MQIRGTALGQQVPPQQKVAQQVAEDPEPQITLLLGQHWPPMTRLLSQQMLPPAAATQVCPVAQQLRPQTWLVAQHWLEFALTRQTSPLLQQER
jgi:hypothetical protein